MTQLVWCHRMHRSVYLRLLLLLAFASAFQAPAFNVRCDKRLRDDPLRSPISPIRGDIQWRKKLSLQVFRGGPGFPPPNRGPGGDADGLVSSVVSTALFVAFFFSPLGSIFFGIINTGLLLVFATPVVLFLAYQLYTTVFLVQAPCPTCGAPAAASKDGNPSMCISCGSTIRSTKDKAGLELCNEAPDFTNAQNGFDLNDIFGGPARAEQVGKTGDPEARKREKRETKIIDIDVEVKDE